ncbi:MAG: EAL domain-containing protein [Sulfurimonas sp.]|nr:EAL domain-containing protein [Sulfurimonas sp.]MBU3937945.1 EAL domain-containing protein [bacterium]MBU4023967.1 EAL domain-containing protein [bacterium]MBU4057918.1 EAL domain-containing protein [bacterium]
MIKDTILVLDDSKVVQAYFTKFINPEEFNILIASDVKKARELIENENVVHTAIININLSDTEDGTFVDYTLKCNIPTLVLTDSKNEVLRKQMISKNIVDCMQKESKDDLIKVVDFVKQLRLNRSKRILIVDDSKTYRMHLDSLLRSHGFVVVEAVNGKDALVKMEQFPDISMLLTDYEMDVMDGLELIHNIRKKYKSVELPIIVLSTHDDSNKIINCLEAGANDYLHKPYKSQEFFSRFYLNLHNSGYVHDIQEQQTLLNQYKEAIDSTNIVSKTDTNGKIIYVNDMFCEASGYMREELIGATYNIIRHHETPQETFNEILSVIKNKKMWHGTMKNRKKSGEDYLVDTTVIPILDAGGNIKEFMSINKDITKVVEQNIIIHKQYTDTLTNLPNRQKLINDLEAANSACLAIINIDSFNEINNFYGYEIGDKVLIAVAEKMKEYTKKTHSLYKLPIDEFALLSKNTIEQGEKRFLNDLLEYLRKNSFIIDENEIYLHFSTGAYSGEKNHLVNADIALQQARVMNKDICSYDDLPDIKAVQQNNLNWIKKLHHAIEEDRIKAFYQPIVNNKDGKIEKYEALVRMMDEGGKPISPFFFLDVAKKTKLYEKLTRTVFDQTMKLAAEVEKSFSINLTVTDFKNIKLMDYIYETLIASKVAKRIVFEIVESEELESKDLLDAITRLKECGSKISIDDFGTGYSNFNYLVKMNADIIKIDGSIIKYILEDKNSELMVKTIVSLANQLGAKTIAEFVESEAIFQKVKELGVDYSQGYFFSMPLESI